MTELTELYQELIVDHGTDPRNHRALNPCSVCEEGYNPLCGDRLQLFLKMDEAQNTISEVTFLGAGCAISMASASLMTEALKGKTLEEAFALFNRFQNLMVTEEECDPALGKLIALMGVRSFPARVKCATLAWHTLHAALQKHAALQIVEVE